MIPHTREARPQFLFDHLPVGSSAHTRGTRTRCAGRLCARKDHPRIRRERTGVRSRSSSVTTDHRRTRGHSRIRGKHLRDADGDRVVVRIIPAYAGSTMGQNSLLTTAFSLVELRSTGIHAARRHHERTRKLSWRRSPLARRPGTARSAGDPVRAPTAERGSHDANVAQQRLDRPNSGRRLRRCACRK